MNFFAGSSQTALSDLVVLYYQLRGYVIPCVEDALLFHFTEVGEASECLLARGQGFVRNNPDDHPPFDRSQFGEELGDAIMMLIVAGLVEGVDPVACLLEKMGRKTGDVVFNTNGGIRTPQANAIG